MKKNNKSVSNTASSLFETPVTLRVPFVSNNVSTRNSIPDPEVPSKATRRRFTTQYKLRILQEVAGVVVRRSVPTSDLLGDFMESMNPYDNI